MSRRPHARSPPTLRPGQLIVLESTTYPGTTRNVVLPILAAGGLAVGSDFFLAYSPERVDPGNARDTAATIPKLVGGIDEASLRLAAALYGAAVAKVVPVSSCEVAEAAKILENTYRAVNIALANELKKLFTAMGIDVWEVIDAAATKPFGFQAFLSRARTRRALHSGRSVLHELARPTTRFDERVYRAGRWGEHRDAGICRRATYGGTERERQGDWRAARFASWVWPTSATWPTRAKAPHFA